MTNETMKEQELRMQSHFLVMTFFFFFFLFKEKSLETRILGGKKEPKGEKRDTGWTVNSFSSIIFIWVIKRSSIPST